MHLSGVKCCVMALLLFGATASWGGDYLYSPAPVEGEAVGDGVLVREVTVKKGDNLSRISKRYSGRDYYYPQILLFNEIKNDFINNYFNFNWKSKAFISTSFLIKTMK